MKNYADNRKEHLCKYAASISELSNIVGGDFRGKGPYGHIMKLGKGAKTNDKFELVKNNNILDGVSNDMYKPEKQHVYAHHLNSSQVLCYNFFRTLIDDDKHPNEQLIKILGDRGIQISKDAVCFFEKGDDDRTEYDFFIKDGLCSISFEIKYTETEFGRAQNDESHLRKYNDIYHQKLQKCPLIADSILSKKDFVTKNFFKYYQLYRNIVRIKDSNQYSIFLYPKENETLSRQFEMFMTNLTGNLKGHVIPIYWEDINGYHKNSEFIKNTLISKL